MKNLVSGIIIIAFVLYPSICFSSYIIQLKNGGEFITYHYWEEGGEIKLHIYGGVMGIQKDFVETIEESNVVHKEKTVSLKKPEPVPVKTEPKGDAKTQKTTPPVESKKEKRFMKEFYLLKERFKDANIMRTQELYQFAEDLTGFRDKVLKNRSGHLYSDQLLEIYSMMDEVEDKIKVKGNYACFQLIIFRAVLFKVSSIIQLSYLTSTPPLISMV